MNNSITLYPDIGDKVILVQWDDIHKRWQISDLKYSITMSCCSYNISTLFFGDSSIFARTFSLFDDLERNKQCDAFIKAFIETYRPKYLAAQKRFVEDHNMRRSLGADDFFILRCT